MQVRAGEAVPGGYPKELVKAGVMLAGEGLHPSTKGVRVGFSGQDRTGFADGAEVEIRPVFEADDFGEAFTPELREAEGRMRQEVASS